MNIEKFIKIEQVGQNREKLLALEREDKYVFHGSPYVADVLEPKQDYIFNKETGKKEAEGNPAVCATPFADIAIFRSLINSKEFNEKSRSKFGVEGEKLNFSATKNLLERVGDKTGFVYVFNKEDFDNFEKFDKLECRSEKSIKPIKVVEVNKNDLPPNIEIIND